VRVPWWGDETVMKFSQRVAPPSSWRYWRLTSPPMLKPTTLMGSEWPNLMSMSCLSLAARVASPPRPSLGFRLGTKQSKPRSSSLLRSILKHESVSRNPCTSTTRFTRGVETEADVNNPELLNGLTGFTGGDELEVV